MPLRIALLSRWYREENRRAGITAGGTVQQLAEAVAALGNEVVVLSQSPEVTKLEKSRIGTLETWLSPRDQRRGGWTTLRDRWEKRRYGHRKVVTDALALRDFLAARGPFDVLWAQCEEPDGLVAAYAEKLGVVLPPTLTQVYALRYGFAKKPSTASSKLGISNGRMIMTGYEALHLAFRQATRILANSELVAECLLAYRDAEVSSAERLQAKTRVVYHNLQTEFLNAASVPGHVAEPGRVLFLGALNEKKGALVFLEALRQTENKDTLFVVAGGVTEKNPDFMHKWEEGLAAARNESRKIELLGKVPAQEIITQIQRASVVVLPSLFDEFSRALVEALVLGRPVITTGTVGAAIFVLKSQAGLVVESDNSVALARAIDELLRPGEPYADNARKLAPRLAHELSPHAIALQIAQHLSEISSA